MYDRQEAAQLRQEFWTAFGLYMKPIPSAEGEKVNWVNYKTGEKHLHFRMEAGNRSVLVAIEFRHPDADLRQIYFEQMRQLKSMLQAHVNEDWSWEPDLTDEHGRAISRVVKEMENVSVLRKDDWPKLVSFLKPRIIALDAFWNEARYFFAALR